MRAPDVPQRNLIRRRRTRADDIAQHGPRLHGIQLRRIAKQDDDGVVAHSVEQLSHHGQIDHRRFVDDHDVGGQRRLDTASERVLTRAVIEQTMQRLRMCMRHIIEQRQE